MSFRMFECTICGKKMLPKTFAKHFGKHDLMYPKLTKLPIYDDTILNIIENWKKKQFKETDIDVFLK